VFFTVVRVLAYLAALASQRLRLRMTRVLTQRMVDSFYGQPYSAVIAHDQGYFVSRLYDEPFQFSSDFVETMVAIIGGTLTFIAGTIVALWLAWKVTIVLSVIIPVLLYLGRRYGAPIAQTTRRDSEEAARLRAALGRAVAAYKTVRCFAMHRFVSHHLESRLEVAQAASYRSAEVAARFRVTSRIFLAYAELGMLLGTGLAVVAGSLTIGGLLGLMTAYWRIVGAFDSLSAQLPSITRLRTQLARLISFESSERRPTLTHSSDIDLRDVSFGFGEKSILNNVTLAVRSGERVVLTGANGTGKSTLGHVVAGLLKPDRGSANIPDESQLSCVLLPFSFAPGSVGDNLGAGSSDEHRLECSRLLRSLRLRVEMDADPSLLSQGEQRKLQIAMALLRKSSFLVLDEPLSHIDTGSRDDVMNTIVREAAGRGLLVIMHGDEKYHSLFDYRLDLGEGSDLEQSEATVAATA
jgi:ABC-type multidrug transport system fused ATPase/permease subunit